MYWCYQVIVHLMATLGVLPVSGNSLRGGGAKTLRPAGHPFRDVPSVVCLRVVVKDGQSGCPGLIGAVTPRKK
jgi:hypothetical protein